MIGKFTRSVPGQTRSGCSGKRLSIALLLLCSCCLAVDEHSFGRLFTTPEQRQRLQELRAEHRQAQSGRDATQTGIRAGAPAPGAAQTGPAPALDSDAQASPVVTLKGLIVREGGAGMVWVDEHDGGTTPDYRTLETPATPGHEVAVPVGMDGKSVMLKPGQSYHFDTGSVTDLPRQSRRLPHGSTRPAAAVAAPPQETTP